jgi:hypothetical protein
VEFFKSTLFSNASSAAPQTPVGGCRDRTPDENVLAKI